MDIVARDPVNDARRFQLLVDAVVDYAIYMFDPNGFVTSWNSGAQRIKQYTADEIIGQHFSRFYTPEDRAAGEPKRALETAAREGRYEKEGWRVRKDGSRFWANVVIDPIRGEAGEIIGFAKVTRDITERREAQLALERANAALAQAQKMEAVGQLTGGIAHDFNNLLTVISSNLDLLARPSLDPQRQRRLIENAQRAAERGAKLTQQLLAFARRQPLKPQRHNVNKVIGSFEAILRHACGETIHLEFDLAPRLRFVDIDAQQLEAALLNLVVNARDAMPSGGRVTVMTGVVDLDSPFAGDELVPASAPHVVVVVTDTGTGMHPEVLARAFDPFFTTKEVGKGTGLGLSQVYGFVTQSGGRVEIESRVGEGTVVKLFLPAGEWIEPSEARGGDPSKTRTGTVLVVDDNPEVLESAAEMFLSLGYDVLTASDGPGALNTLQREGGIDILFTDIVMPKGIDGVELARRACRLRPHLRVLLASGYPVSALNANQGLTTEFAFISKPYRWSELADKLRDIMAPR